MQGKVLLQILDILKSIIAVPNVLFVISGMILAIISLLSVIFFWILKTHLAEIKKSEQLVRGFHDKMEHEIPLLKAYTYYVLAAELKSPALYTKALRETEKICVNKSWEYYAICGRIKTRKAEFFCEFDLKRAA